MTSEPDPFIETLKAAGLEEVRYRLDRNAYNDVGKRRSKAKAWVAQEERRIAAEVQAAQNSIASRTADATERQATAGGLAARGTIAAVVVAIVVAILAMLRHQQ
jgi:hypothetical protein